LCLDGERSAYTLTTGSSSNVLADASAIGINSLLRYKFHQSITCSPLRMDGLVYPFISENRTPSFRYFYGNRIGDWNCTSDLPYCTFEVLFYPDLNRQPIFNVNETYGEAATMMLISNFGISYPSESLDPIFPVNTTYGDGWYYNTRYYATVLGCMSRTLVCLLDTTPAVCYNLTGLGNLDDTDQEHGSVRVMLYFSLLPNLEAQLGYLRAEALDAQSLLSGSTSSEISNN
jgi:hypothetical protein